MINTRMNPFDIIENYFPILSPKKDAINQAFKTSEKLLSTLTIEGGFAPRFWVPLIQSSIQIELRDISKPGVSSQLRSLWISHILESLKKLIPFTVKNNPTQHFHLFFDDLNRCWQLGLLNSLEHQRLIVKLSHPLDWIDFCLSLPNKNSQLNREMQYLLLKGAMADYTEDIFNNTFAMASHFSSEYHHYALYLAATVVDTTYRSHCLFHSLGAKKSFTHLDLVPKNCFYFHFREIFRHLSHRHLLCKFLSTYIERAYDDTQKDLLKQFIDCWQIKGWNIEANKIAFSSVPANQINALAYLCYINPPLDIASLHVNLADSIDLISLLHYLRDKRSNILFDDSHELKTLSHCIEDRIRINWLRGIEGEDYRKQITDLTKEDIPVLLNIIKPGSKDRDTQKFYNSLLAELKTVGKMTFLRNQLQLEVEKIKQEKKKIHSWFWHEDEPIKIEVVNSLTEQLIKFDPRWKEDEFLEKDPSFLKAYSV